MLFSTSHVECQLVFLLGCQLLLLFPHVLAFICTPLTFRESVKLGMLGYVQLVTWPLWATLIRAELLSERVHRTLQ